MRRPCWKSMLQKFSDLTCFKILISNIKWTVSDPGNWRQTAEKDSAALAQGGGEAQLSTEKSNASAWHFNKKKQKKVNNMHEPTDVVLYI